MPRRRGSAASQAHAVTLSLARQAPRLPLEEGSAGTSDPQPSGQGRGPGKVNQRIAQMLAARGYPQPWEGLAHIASRSTADLARYLGCTRLEALKEQVRCMIELMPFTAKKLPIELAGGLDLIDTRSDDAIASAILDKVRALRQPQALPKPDDGKSKA